MSSEIVWLPGATKDIARLRSFIKSENPRAAQRAAKRIIEGVNILQENPEAGVPVEYPDELSGLNAGLWRRRIQHSISKGVG